MYLVFSLVMFLVAAPWRWWSAPSCSCRHAARGPGFFNTMTTVHALIMVFGAVMPATVASPTG